MLWACNKELATMRAVIGHYAVLIFCIVVVALTFAAYLLPLPKEAIPLLIVFIPTLTGMVLTMLEGQSVGEYLGQLAPGHLSLKWAGISVLVGLTLRVGVMLLGLALSVPGSLTPGSFMPFLVIVFIFAGAEELGWRGYALPRVLKTYSPLAAGLLLGVPWALVHLVLYLPGMMFAGLPVIPTLIVIWALSVLLTWAYVKAGQGGVLATTLLHGSQNFFVFLNNGIDPATANWLMAVVYVTAAILISTLAREWFFRAAKSPNIALPQSQHV
jgi:membrane protease YdiL (CAAX protease family)